MIGLSIEHQGRELLHGIALLNYCLAAPMGTAAIRRQWKLDVRKARVDLDALYVAGLSRNFCTDHR